MTGPVRLAGAGIGIVGASFGMARYGYGLLLPDIRHDYGLGPGTLGAIGTAGYVAYLLATSATGAFAGRAGPRRTAVGAGLLAALGMAIAGLTHSPAGLLVGVLTGGASAGLAFPPFSDAAGELAPRSRGRVLAAINCGTGYGVAVAAPIAIAAGSDWHAAWLACAAAALLAAGWAGRVLPRSGGVGREPGPLRALRHRRARPLLVGGVLIGLGSSAFWTFAVERLTEVGALAPSATRSFLGVVGVASILATLASDLVGRLGARRAFRACAAAEGRGGRDRPARAGTRLARGGADRRGAVRRGLQRRRRDPGALGGAAVRAAVARALGGDGGERPRAARRPARGRPAGGGRRPGRGARRRRRAGSGGRPLRPDRLPLAHLTGQA